ncbi:MAG: hypothetical protein A2Z95_03005 [Gallionellales bacterium GWA2_60_18]|nr:MAG: hypothetical protein A2Z95_03005 [Gallionellales bacterium GWA2_60_18]
MSRLLLLIAIVIVVYLLVRSFRSKVAAQDKPKTVTEDMVRCVQCGVHLPRSEAIQSQEKFFCCVAHRDAYLK